MQPRRSIHDPEYRYPESKNPYWAKVRELGGLIYPDNETETHAGKWRGQFANSAGSTAALHLELGCNAGHVTVEWAKRNPAAYFIGLDWKFKAIHRGAEKARKLNLGNLIFFRGYSERTEFMFGAGEVDHLYLFFPDPWPKKAHWKHRFVNPENLARLAKIVRPGGSFEIKTDHAGYFDWMEDALRECTQYWEVKARTRDLHAGHPEPAKLAIPDVTLFEKLFIKDQIPIHRLGITRRLQS